MTYNIDSFMQFDERLEAVMQELGGAVWDVIVFTETWREEAQETFETKFRHTWFGSGGRKGAHGIGILLHSKWNYKAFNPVSDRLRSCAGDRGCQ